MRDPAEVDRAYRVLESVRWPRTPRCAHCGSPTVTFLRPVDGSRRTRTGSVTARRVWKCATCQRQFSATTGTVLHGTRIDLSVWLAAVTSLAADGAVPAPRTLVHDHGLSWDAARHVHRVLVAACRVPSIAAALPADGSATPATARARPD